MATLKAPTSEQFLNSSLEGYDVSQEVSFLDGAAAADVIQFAIIPKGSAIFDGYFTTNAANAGATVSVGWAAVDGSDSDPDAFVAAGTSIATAGAHRFNAGAISRAGLPVDAYLTMTVAGAAISAATDIFVRPTVTNIGTE